MKVVLLGDSAVGKSSIVETLMTGQCSQQHNATIGAAFVSKTIGELNLNVWDTAGEEAYRSLTRLYYNDAAVALVVCDVGVRQTFESMASWCDDVVSNTRGRGDVKIVLVGNKCDLAPSQRVVAEDELQSFARLRGLEYCECSAFRKSAVDALFEHVAEVASGRKSSGSSDRTDTTTLRFGESITTFEGLDARSTNTQSLE